MNDAAFEKHCKWYEKNLKIVTKKQKLEPLVLNHIQRRLERDKIETFAAEKPFFAIVLKARQEGVSTWSEAMFFRDSVEMPHRKALVVAHKEESTRAIFKMTKRYHRNFPGGIKTERSSARTLAFEDNQSEFSIQTAGAEEDAGRSLTCHALHISEFDYCPNADDMLGAVLQTIPDTYPSVIIIESTAKGPGGPMQALWDMAVKGETAFVPYFFPWFDEPEYSREITTEEVEKYAPEQWKIQNRQIIQAVKRREKHGLGRHGTTVTGSGDDGEAGTAESYVPGAAGEDSGDQQPEAVLDEGADGGEGAARGGPVHGVPKDRGTDSDGPGAVPGESDDAGGGWVRPFRDGGGRAASGNAPRDRKSEPVSAVQLTALDLFKDSLTSYEIGLIEEFQLSYEQIHWLRYCLKFKCSGNESTRKREYPSRPEEAFEAAEGSIFDPTVLAKWKKAADQMIPSRGSMHLETFATKEPTVVYDHTDRQGKVEVYEPPRYGHRYVCGNDCSNGVTGGDFIVACVLDVDSGVQVAEYRALVDQDVAADEIQALCYWYNKATVAPEVNGGYGMPFLRRYLDDKLVPVYERLVWDKMERDFVKRPGWSTDAKTRPLMIGAMRMAIRQETILLKSKATISECFTLHEKRGKDIGVGRIEARPNCTDDGVFAAGIAQMMRLELVRNTRKSEDEKRKQTPMMKRFEARFKAKQVRGALAPTFIRPGGKTDAHL